MVKNDLFATQESAVLHTINFWTWRLTGIYIVSEKQQHEPQIYSHNGDALIAADSVKDISCHYGKGIFQTFLIYV